MEPAPIGDSVAMVVRLQPAADGTWYVYIDGANIPEALPLVPVVLILQLWRASTTNVLRAVVRIHGREQHVLIQSNAQLVELVRAWLFSGDEASGRQ